ncbi:MAG TPA: motility-associated protein, partial [Bryobacteraceae bacterium]|nr:motility-associated protein [Bryobacteraceae bacterium]
MLAIIGIVVVFGAVVGGYLMEHGNLKVLMQPAELLIIGGAGAGTILTANPISILKSILAGFSGVFGNSKYDKAAYQSTLKQMYDVMQKARKKGLTELEKDVEEPDKSPLFKTWDHHLRDFVCDTLRMAMTGGPTPFDLDQLMELD